MTIGGLGPCFEKRHLRSEMSAFSWFMTKDYIIDANISSIRGSEVLNYTNHDPTIAQNEAAKRFHQDGWVGNLPARIRNLHSEHCHNRARSYALHHLCVWQICLHNPLTARPQEWISILPPDPPYPPSTWSIQATLSLIPRILLNGFLLNLLTQPSQQDSALRFKPLTKSILLPNVKRALGLWPHVPYQSVHPDIRERPRDSKFHIFAISRWRYCDRWCPPRRQQYYHRVGGVTGRGSNNYSHLLTQ